MIEESAVIWSRLQFGATAMYHFLFVPLTLGLSWILVIMESVYVMTDRPIWRQMTQFWGILFGINFAMGVCTGVPLEFQFGTNWAYYSHYVGDVFGSLLAIEGLMAFFLEATFIGLFFFGWKVLSKVGHLIVTFLVALGSNLSALWILLANGWMQNPVGSHFNIETLRMELVSFYEILFNPVAQAKFVHTLSAGYVTGSMFVLSLSAYYLLKGRHIAFAKRSMAVAASFGLAGALSVVVLGDESGYTTSENQKAKLAAMEGVWHTEKAPAGLTLLGWPDEKNMVTHYEIKIPWLLGLIATRSLDGKVIGIHDLITQAEQKIRNGMKAYSALQILKTNPQDEEARKKISEAGNHLGYGLLLKRYTAKVEDATEEQIHLAAKDTIPKVAPLFWSFRIMVGLGFYFILLFAVAFYFSARGAFEKKRWFLRLAVFSLPLPWVAAELGWFVAEYGRQPWTIDGILPTFLSASSIPAAHVKVTFFVFVIFYSILAVVDVFLMRKYIKLGPDTAVKSTE